MTRWIIRTGCAVAFGLSATLTSAVSSPALAQTKEPIRLGVIFPLSGTAAQAGASGMVGVKLAVKDIGESGGIAGRPINMIVADDRLDTTQAVTEVKRLINQDHIEMLVGAAASQVALAVMPVVTEGKIPFVTFVGSSARRVSAPKGFPISKSPPSICFACHARPSADAWVKRDTPRPFRLCIAPNFAPNLSGRATFTPHAISFPRPSVRNRAHQRRSCSKTLRPGPRRVTP